MPAEIVARGKCHVHIAADATGSYCTEDPAEAPGHSTAEGPGRRNRFPQNFSTTPPGISKQNIVSRCQGLYYYYLWVKHLKLYLLSMICGTVTALVVFVINVLLTLWAVRMSGVYNGIGTLQHRSCGKDKDAWALGLSDY